VLLLFIVPQPAPASPGFINTALVVGDLWPPLNARGPADAVFWTEAELYAWIDEAVKRFARKHAAFVVYDQTILAVTGTADYNLPAAHVLTFQADLDGRYLRARNVQEMDALDATWPTAAAGKPKAFLEDTKGLTQLALYPPPTVAYNGKAVGLVMAELPAAISAAAAILAAPPILREYFTFFALGEARAKETNASMDETAEWFRGLVDMIDQVAEHLWSSHGE
jgi:hypothetical protein